VKNLILLICFNLLSNVSLVPPLNHGCGAEQAPWEFSFCRSARYCDYECAVRHWRGEQPGAGGRHRDECPRTMQNGELLVVADEEEATD
jgi:hypothetical protein